MFINVYKTSFIEWLCLLFLIFFFFVAFIESYDYTNKSPGASAACGHGHGLPAVVQLPAVVKVCHLDRPAAATAFVLQQQVAWLDIAVHCRIGNQNHDNESYD